MAQYRNKAQCIKVNGMCWIPVNHSEMNSSAHWAHPFDNCLGGSSIKGIHPSSTGGGTGVDTVFVVTSPIIASASLVAWYIRNISSRRWASSADSSINKLCASTTCSYKGKFMYREIVTKKQATSYFLHLPRHHNARHNLIQETGVYIYITVA